MTKKEEIIKSLLESLQEEDVEILDVDFEDEIVSIPGIKDYVRHYKTGNREIIIKLYSKAISTTDRRNKR